MIKDVIAASELFARTVNRLTDEQLRGPSALPGWTRAHVIAHVVLNAEGFICVATTPRDQQPALMYPGGTGTRDRDIDTLSSATASNLRQRLHEANARFLELWDPAPSLRDCATAEGHPTFPSSSVLSRRLRELQVHLLDLDLDDAGIDAWLPVFVQSDLSLQWPTVAHRTSEQVSATDEFGVVWETSTSTAAHTNISVLRRDLLAWVLDRLALEGFPQLEPWSNRSRWEWTATAESATEGTSRTSQS